MLIKQNGIIIKSVDYGESDRIITILNEHGAKNPTYGETCQKGKIWISSNNTAFC